MADPVLYDRGEFQGAVLNPLSGEMALNMKQLVDDNQEHSRRRADNAADFDKAMNQITVSDAQHASLVKHAINSNALISAQVSNIETQQTVSPVRQATGDAIVGGVGVSAEQVAANVADLATSLVPVIASALATAISQTIAALVPVVVNSSGGASTPSQTQAKSS
jgi:hypothetical protein